MELKDILKNRRIELGLTLDEVAHKTGVSAPTISRWESGDIANMRRDKIMSYAKALELSPAVVMGWKEPVNIAAHHGGLEEIEDWTEEEKKEIEQFKAYVRSKRG